MLDDAGFLAGNLFQRVAQELYVVKADVGDDAHQRLDDVGAVESAAQPHFDDGYIHPLLLEELEGESRCQFEERRVERLEEAAFLLHEIHYALLGHHLSVDTYAFSEIRQMRTRVESHLHSLALQYGCQCVAHRAFPIGAGHMDGGIMSVRVVEVFVEQLRVAETFLIRTRPDILE